MVTEKKVYGRKEKTKEIEKLSGRNMINKLAIAKKLNEVIEAVNEIKDEMP